MWRRTCSRNVRTNAIRVLSGVSDSGHNDAGFYDRIAGQYDTYRRPGGPHMPRLHALALEAGARRVLELGPGTGNSGLAFLEGFDGTLFGLDASFGMLQEHAAKNLPVLRANGDATRLPFGGNAFEFIFGVLMLHHVRNLDALAAECFRVISSGACGFVTAPRRFIDDYPLNDYFPSFAKIDRGRFQHEDVVAQTLRSSGFADVSIDYFAKDPEPIDAAYVEKIRGRFISTYALIPDDEFEAGLARLEAEIETTGALDRPMVWESVVISAWKR